MGIFRSLGILLFCAATASADDWPQWLGPTRDGVSTVKVAPWKEPPKVVWQQAVGAGHSSPIVAGGRVFLHVKAKDKDEEEIAAFDAKSGKELWRQAYPRAPFKSPFGVGPRATPIASGGRVYTFGVTGVLACWQADDGKPVWQVDTTQEFKPAALVFGVSCSPIIEEGNLVVNVGGPGASVVAFKKETGLVAWKVLDDKASYSSPIAIGRGKDRQIIVLTHEGLVGLSPAQGKALWRFGLVDKLSESSTTPVLAGDLLLASSVTYGSACLRLETRDGAPGFAEAWKNPALTCYISTPAVVGDRAFLVTGTIIPPPSATLRCVELKTGKVLWSRPDTGRYHAALVRTAEDRLLMLDDDGGLALLDPSPAEYKELARSKICGPTWAHPALVDGRLYVRDNKALLCLQVSE
jgi:outer membrane protein assembly factor BamB